jgi:hypothetical protein
VLPVGSATVHGCWRLRGQPAAPPRQLARTSRPWGLVEVFLVQGLAGTIWWCPGGALLVQLPGTTLRLMFLTEGVRCS